MCERAWPGLERHGSTSYCRPNHPPTQTRTHAHTHTHTSLEYLPPYTPDAASQVPSYPAYVLTHLERHGAAVGPRHLDAHARRGARDARDRMPQAHVERRLQLAQQAAVALRQQVRVRVASGSGAGSGSGSGSSSGSGSGLLGFARVC